MGCRHRIAYLFLCLLHIIILIALALTLVGCENNFLKCKDNCKDFPSSLKGCKLNLNDDKGSISAGKILFLVGVVISVVAFVLILLNIYKCISIKKWKRSIKKRFRWILIVLLLMAVALIASFSQLKKENTTTKNSNFTKILSTLTTVIAVVEVFLVLFMLCCKPAKKKEKEDDDDDGDSDSDGDYDDDDKDNGHNRKDKKTGGKSSDGAGNGVSNNTFHVFLNIPGLRGDDGKFYNPFRKLHSTTPSNVYGSAD